MAKPYTLVERDGKQYRDYGDGILRNERGHIAVRQEGMPTITHENAHQYHAMRKQKILDAIEAKLQDITRTKLPSEAIAAIVGKRAAIAMNDDTRTGNEAAKIVLSAVDAYQNRVTDTNVTTQRHEYTIDDDTKLLLSELLRERRDNTQVIDVESMGENEE